MLTTNATPESGRASLAKGDMRSKVCLHAPGPEGGLGHNTAQVNRQVVMEAY